MEPLQTRVVPVNELRLDPENVRLHGPENLAAIKASIARWGQVLPLVVRDGVVLGGNATLTAIRALGLPTAVCVDFSGPPEEGRALAIALNRTAELATWDLTKLGTALAELSDSIEISDLGFSDADIRTLWPDIDEEMKHVEFDARNVTEDEAPEPPKVPVSRVGDVWHLGRHKLVCGSCEDAGAFVDPAAVKLLVTDPPYGVSYAAKNEFLNAIDRGDKVQTPIEGDDQTPEEMSEFWVRCFSAVRPLMAPGAAYYVTGPQGGDLLLLLLALRTADFPLRHMLVWIKNNFVLGRSDYHYKHEPILYGWVAGTHHAVADRGECSVWEIDKPHKSDLHPTMKPVSLYARAMVNSSDAGDLVLDPFAGSGTAIAAAEQTDRACTSIEIAPAYCDVIVERWQTLTGGKARRA